MDQPNSSARQASDTPADARALQRRLLLRGVAAGGALVGAASPLTAHATGGKKVCVKSSKNYNATASAVGSMVGSAAAVTTPVAGHTCAHYKNSGNWRSGWTNGYSKELTYSKCVDPDGTTKLRFYEVFEFANPGSGLKSRTCQNILNYNATSDEAVWLTAMFNANKRSPFTYTPAGIISLYRSKNPLVGDSYQAGLDAKALQLFRDYLSDIA